MTKFARNCSFAMLACAAALSAGRASAQQPYPAPGTTLSARDQTCRGLEAQLANIDRAAGDQGKAEQIRRLEETVGRQQTELDRYSQQARQKGCDAPAFFQMFGGAGRTDQCTALNNQIQQMRSNLARMQADLQRLQGAGANYERDGQRRSVIQALAQNDCGPQYRAQAAQSRNLFETLFGPGPGGDQNSTPNESVGSGYRTVCVRTCDGAYFPVSFATMPARFQDDEKTCKALCPATEANLYAYPNPGGDMNQAVSTTGQPYTALPTAFKFRASHDPSCSCKGAGQTWSDALKSVDDKAMLDQQGDIIVTEESAKKMQQQKMQAQQPKGAPGAPATAGKKGAPAPGTTAGTPPAQPAEAPKTADGKDKPIRSVGPTFIPNNNTTTR